MKRYEKFAFEAEKGIPFEVSEGTRGELIIRTHNIATANYANPPIQKDISMSVENGTMDL